MVAKLYPLVEVDRNPATNETEDDLEAILSALNNDANIKLAKRKVLYDQAMNALRAVHSQLVHRVAPSYVSFQSGYVNFAEGLRNTLGFCHFANQESRFAPTF